MIRASWIALGVVALGATSFPSPSLADSDLAAAEALADAGAKLMALGRFDEGCEKYERSERIDPSVRRILKVADCNERRGRTASSWVAFSQALDLAEEGQDRDALRFAKEGVSRIEQNLAKIQILIPDDAARVAGLEVRRDGFVVPPPVFGVAVPVDPGQHVITATAPDRHSWSVQLGVARGPAVLSVTIPLLDALPAAERHETLPRGLTPPDAPPRDATSRESVLVDPFAARDGVPPRTGPDFLSARTGSSLATAPSSSGEGARTVGSTQRTVGWVLGGAGVVSLAAGMLFGLEAMATRDDIDSACPGGLCSSASALDWHDRFTSQARASTAFIGLGLTSLAAGVIVYLTAPPDATPSRPRSGNLQVTPTVAPGSAGVLASATFR